MELNSLYSRAVSTKERIATATHVVSYWWLPGGYDAERAHVRFAFFDNEQEAQQFADLCETAWPQPKPRVRLSKQPQATF